MGFLMQKVKTLII